MQMAFFTPSSANRWPAMSPASNSVCPTCTSTPSFANTSLPEFIEITGIPAATAALIEGPSASASGMLTTRPSGSEATAASISWLMATMSNVSGAWYATWTPMSSAAAFTPLAATDQNGSDAWPWVTTTNRKSRCFTAPPFSPSSPPPVHAAPNSASTSRSPANLRRFIPPPFLRGDAPSRVPPPTPTHRPRTMVRAARRTARRTRGLRRRPGPGRSPRRVPPPAPCPAPARTSHRSPTPRGPRRWPRCPRRPTRAAGTSLSPRRPGTPSVRSAPAPPARPRRPSGGRGQRDPARPRRARPGRPLRPSDGRCPRTGTRARTPAGARPAGVLRSPCPDGDAGPPPGPARTPDRSPGRSPPRATPTRGHRGPRRPRSRPGRCRPPGRGPRPRRRPARRPAPPPGRAGPPGGPARGVPPARTRPPGRARGPPAWPRASMRRWVDIRRGRARWPEGRGRPSRRGPGRARAGNPIPGPRRHPTRWGRRPGVQRDGSPDLLQSHRPVLGPGAATGHGDAERRQGVLGRAGALPPARREPDEPLHLRPIRLGEPGLEMRIRVGGCGRGPRLHGAERHPTVPPHHHAVARTEQLHPNVVAEGVVAGDREDPEGPARQPERSHGRVDVPVLLEDREPDHRAVRVRLHHLLAGDEPEGVEVVHAEVAEDASRDGNVCLVRRRGVVSRHPHHIEGPDSTAGDQITGGSVPAIEPALESHLEGDPRIPDMGHDLRGRRDVERDRLLAERGEPGLGRLVDQWCVRVGGGRDHHRVGSFHGIGDVVRGLHTELLGNGPGTVPIDVGHEHVDGRKGSQCPSVDQSHAPHADHSDPHQRGPLPIRTGTLELRSMPLASPLRWNVPRRGSRLGAASRRVKAGSPHNRRVQEGRWRP